jgi:hypothetical protein
VVALERFLLGRSNGPLRGLLFPHFSLTLTLLPRILLLLLLALTLGVLRTLQLRREALPSALRFARGWTWYLSNCAITSASKEKSTSSGTGMRRCSSTDGGSVALVGIVLPGSTLDKSLRFCFTRSLTVQVKV